MCLQGGGILRPYNAHAKTPTPLSAAFVNALPRPSPVPTAAATAAPTAAKTAAPTSNETAIPGP